MELANGRVVLHAGDCLEVLASLPENSIDAVVTDPPYELGFMGKSWDASGVAFCPDTWRLIWRVLKPGGHMVAFGAPKNYHRLACAIEDAGFEIRDSLMWVFGTGFPKSMDVSKAITKQADQSKVHEIKVWLAGEFERCGKTKSAINKECGFTASDYLKTEPGSDAVGRDTWHLLLPYGDKWEKLKSVVGFSNVYDEDISQYGVIAGKRRQKVATGDVYGDYSGEIKDYSLTPDALKWDGWGTALKPAYEPIVLARKPLSEKTVAANVLRWGTGALNIDATRICMSADDFKSTQRTGDYGETSSGVVGFGITKMRAPVNPAGRWPANLCHDGSQQVLDLFPHTKSGALKPYTEKHENASSFRFQREKTYTSEADEGSAARFFYSAKASKADRAGSKHPTVKPVSLMQWLVRMVTPSGGKVLDPFAGSGTTGQAAVNEGFDAVLIERELEYQTDIRNRLDG